MNFRPSIKGSPDTAATLGMGHDRIEVRDHRTTMQNRKGKRDLSCWWRWHCLPDNDMTASVFYLHAPANHLPCTGQSITDRNGANHSNNNALPFRDEIINQHGHYIRPVFLRPVPASFNEIQADRPFDFFLDSKCSFYRHPCIISSPADHRWAGYF